MARVSHLVVVRPGKEPLLTCLCLETEGRHASARWTALSCVSQVNKRPLWHSAAGTTAAQAGVKSPNSTERDGS